MINMMGLLVSYSNKKKKSIFDMYQKEVIDIHVKKTSRHLL